MRNSWFRTSWLVILVLVVAATGLWQGQQSAVAQEGTPNLLVNGGLETPYYGQGAPTRTAPNGWFLWVGAGAPEAFPHTDPIQILDGAASWNVKQGYTAFTAAGYQRVSGLTAGDVVKLTAYGWLYTCNNITTSCVIPDPPYRQSDTSAGASLKVGIDPKGGTNPASADIVWSALASPYDQWAELTVTAEVEGDAATVFLYMSQSAGLAINNVYWDKVSLVRTEEGVEAQAPAEVPFVTPQGVRPDGSIVHVVQAGDTLSSIAYAYREYGVTNESIAALNEGMKPNTRVLLIGQEVVILPPGSVDPVTGQPLAPGTTLAPATAATPIPTPTALPITPPSQPDSESAPPTTQPESAAPVNFGPAQAEFAPFEKGFMFWLEDTNQIFVLVNGADSQQGTFTAYQNTWMQGMPETDPSIVAPTGFTQPEKRFGQAWRTYAGVRESLGWATAETESFTALVIRQDELLAFNGPDGRVYQLDLEGNWFAVDLAATE